MDLSIEISNFPPFIREDTALCAETDPELFFLQDDYDVVNPYRTKSSYPDLAAAKKICARCPLVAACLEYAIKEDIAHGIWGGATPKERQKLSTRRNLRMV